MYDFLINKIHISVRSLVMHVTITGDLESTFAGFSDRLKASGRMSKFKIKAQRIYKRTSCDLFDFDQ